MAKLVSLSSYALRCRSLFSTLSVFSAVAPASTFRVYLASRRVCRRRIPPHPDQRPTSIRPSGRPIQLHIYNQKCEIHRIALPGSTYLIRRSALSMSSAAKVTGSTRCTPCDLVYVSCLFYTQWKLFAFEGTCLVTYMLDRGALGGPPISSTACTCM